MSPLSVPNFSLVGARIRVVGRILRSVRKEEKKNPKFGRSYLGNGLSDFQYSNLECGLPYLAGTSVATLVSIG